MNLFKRIFGQKDKGKSLSPLHDPVLGHLHWDVDLEGWVGTVRSNTQNVRLYLGSGSAQEYPSEQIKELLREPYIRFAELEKTAVVFLRNNVDHQAWKVDLATFVADGLESYEHYVKDGTYTITFADSTSENIWRVDFRDGQPIGVGADD